MGGIVLEQARGVALAALGPPLARESSTVMRAAPRTTWLFVTT